MIGIWSHQNINIEQVVEVAAVAYLEVAYLEVAYLEVAYLEVAYLGNRPGDTKYAFDQR